MSEHTLDTVLGDEIEVKVIFDFQPEEKQTWDYPGYPASVDIEAVLVNGREDSDIQAVLSDKVIDSLTMECFGELNNEAG